MRVKRHHAGGKVLGHMHAEAEVFEQVRQQGVGMRGWETVDQHEHVGTQRRSYPLRSFASHVAALV